jgi:hypothetical protein
MSISPRDWQGGDGSPFDLQSLSWKTLRLLEKLSVTDGMRCRILTEFMPLLLQKA